MTDRGQSTADTRRTKVLEIVANFVDRQSRGESVESAELCSRYAELMPELGEELTRQRLIAQARREFERAADPQLHPTHDTDQSSTDTATLVVRCPHCANSIEILADLPWSDITCVACGNVFSLVSDRFATHNAPTLKKIAHFELIERIGVGGFGTVWKARDTILDRAVALKLPRRGQLTEEDIDKFLREARAAAQLRHPNIVSVHEVGRTEETVYIVSDLVRGVSLSDWAAIRSPSVREVAELCYRIASALEHAHQIKIVHRDLKPGNIMVDAHNEPHIMDFGLAKREAGEVTMTVEGQLLGTPAYMAPEQALGQAHECSPRTDVYSLGVVLFELLTGALPFRGNTSMLLHQVVNDEPPHPRTLNNHIPVDLETICLRCLEKDPARRFESAGPLADELKRFIQGEAILSRPAGPALRLIRWVRRHTTVAGLAVSFLLAMIVGTSATTYFALMASGFQRKAERSERKAEGFERQAAQAETEIKKKDTRIRQAQMGLSVDASSIFAEGSSLMRGAYNRQLQAATRVGHDRPDQVLGLLEDESRCPIKLHDYVWRRLHRQNSWDVQFAWPRLSGPCAAMAFASDGRRLNLLGGNSRVSYEPDSAGRWRETAIWEYRLPYRAAAFRPNDLALVTCTQTAEGARFWLQVEPQAEPLPWLTDVAWAGTLEQLAFSPDGRYLACTGTQRAASEPPSDEDLPGQRTTRLIIDTRLQTIVETANSPQRITDLAWLARDPAEGPAERATVGCLTSGTIEAWVTPQETAAPLRWPEFSAARQVAIAGEVWVVAEDEFLWWQQRRADRQWLRVSVPKGGICALAASSDRVAACSRSGELMIRQVTREPATWKFNVPGGSLFEFSSDGHLLAVAADESLRIFDLQSQRELEPLAVDRAVIDIAWSPSSARLAYCQDDGTVRFVDIKGTRLGVDLPTDAVWTCVAFRSDTELLLGDQQGRVVTYDVSSQRSELLYQFQAAVRDVEHNAATDLIAASGGPDIRLIRRDGRSMDLQGHVGEVQAVSFSRSGEGSLLSCAADGEVRRWRPNWQTSKASHLELAAEVTDPRTAEISADDQTLLTICHDRLQFWDGKTGEYRGSLQASERVLAARFSTWPAGVTMRVAVLLANGDLEVWDGDESPSQWTLFPGGVVRDLAWLQQPAQLIAVGDLPQITGINPTNLSERQVVPTETFVSSIAVSRDVRGPLRMAVVRSLLPAAAGTRELTLFSLSRQTLDPLTPISIPPEAMRSDFHRVRLDDAGHTLVALARSGALTVFELNAAPQQLGAYQLPRTDHEPGIVSCFALASDGRSLLAGNSDGRIHLWRRAETSWSLAGEQPAHRGEVLDVVQLSDGRWGSLGVDLRCLVWDTEFKQSVAEHSLPAGYMLAASPTQPMLATAQGNKVQLWQVGSSEFKRQGEPLADHRGVITAMVFAHDGGMLATAAEDRTIRFWSVGAGKPNVRSLQIPFPVSAK